MERGERYACVLVLDRLDVTVTCLACGPVFPHAPTRSGKSKEVATLVLGCDDGKLKLFTVTPHDTDRAAALVAQEALTLQSGGAALQRLLLCDMTQFGSGEILTGGADGSVFVFSDMQLVSRVSLARPIASSIW